MHATFNAVLLGLALQVGLAGAQSSAHGPAKVSGVLPTQLIDEVEPVYPQAAKDSHIQGAVALVVLVAANGSVKSVIVLSGPADLRRAAKDAVLQWRYRPALVGTAAAGFVDFRTVLFTVGDHDAGDPVTGDPFRAGLAGIIAVPSEAMASLLITKVNPAYPPDAKASGQAGSVLLDILIGADGEVLRVNATSGPDALRDSAIEAVRQYTYPILLHNGRPTKVQTTVSVNFMPGG